MANEKPFRNLNKAAEAYRDITICHSKCLNVIATEDDNLFMRSLNGRPCPSSVNIIEYILESKRKTEEGFFTGNCPI